MVEKIGKDNYDDYQEMSGYCQDLNFEIFERPNDDNLYVRVYIIGKVESITGDGKKEYTIEEFLNILTRNIVSNNVDLVR